MTCLMDLTQKEKRAGSTRSVHGRRDSDTSANLKKTFKKLGVCFWDYLRYLIGKIRQIKPSSDLVTEREAANH